MRSPLAEGASDLIAQRLDQVLQRRAGVGLDEHLRRHAGNQPKFAQTIDFRLRQRRVNEVVGRYSSCARLLAREIGRDMGHDAVELGHRALVAGHNPHGGLPADLDLVDVLRRHLDFQDEFFALGHDLHDRFTVADYATDGVDGQQVDDARVGRANVDALELVVGGDHALDQLGDLALRLAQVFQDPAAEFLIKLDDLQLGLADPGAGARDLGNELAAVAFEPGPLALQRHVAGDADKVLLVEIGDADQLFGDEFDLAFLGLLLRGEPTDLLVALRDALSELGPLAGSGRLARLEQLLLAVDGVENRRFTDARATRSCGNAMVSAPSRSAIRRACRALLSSSWDRTTPSVARVTVSSSRTRTWPSATTLPSRTSNSLTTPPVGCCTFLTFDFTVTVPDAITAPASSLVAAHPPMQTTNAITRIDPTMFRLRVALLPGWLS